MTTEELMKLAEAYAWHSVHGAETNGESVVGAKDALQDALQSQAERIKSQDAEIERLTVERDVNKRMRDQHFAELEDLRSQVTSLNEGFSNCQMERNHIAAHRDHIAKVNDKFRAELAALHGDDELPELPYSPYIISEGRSDGTRYSHTVYTKENAQAYARQAQSMVRAKMVPLEKDAGRYSHLMAYHVHQIAPIFGVSFGSYTPALETITKVSAAIDTARGITGGPK
jgi:septal ring factor EnvC (AmiA/AmiB activator)